MKKTKPKLTLSQETVRPITTVKELQAVAGATTSCLILTRQSGTGGCP